jgi:hypothetical protein
MGAEKICVKKVIGYGVIVVRTPSKSRVVKYICIQEVIITFGIRAIEFPKI